MKCPLCTEDCVQLIEKYSGTNNRHYTPIWVCDACPFIAFEYHVDADLQALTEHLNRTS